MDVSVREAHAYITRILIKEGQHTYGNTLESQNDPPGLSVSVAEALCFLIKASHELGGRVDWI